MEVAGSRRPAGETCGGMSCGDWGNFFLSCAVLRSAVFSAAAVCRCSLGLLSGEKEGFHSFQTTPLWLLPHCFPPLQPLQSLHIGSKPSTGPDGVIDALTSAWDGQLGAGWLSGWLGWGPSDIPHASSNLLFPCSRMRVAASGAATWDLTRYIGPVRPQTLCR